MLFPEICWITAYKNFSLDCLCQNDPDFKNTGISVFKQTWTILVQWGEGVTSQIVMPAGPVVRFMESNLLTFQSASSSLLHGLIPFFLPCSPVPKKHTSQTFKNNTALLAASHGWNEEFSLTVSWEKKGMERGKNNWEVWIGNKGKWEISLQKQWSSISTESAWHNWYLWVLP